MGERGKRVLRRERGVSSRVLTWRLLNVCRLLFIFAVQRGSLTESSTSLEKSIWARTLKTKKRTCSYFECSALKNGAPNKDASMYKKPFRNKQHHLDLVWPIIRRYLNPFTYHEASNSRPKKTSCLWLPLLGWYSCAHAYGDRSTAGLVLGPCFEPLFPSVSTEPQ